MRVTPSRTALAVAVAVLATSCGGADDSSEADKRPRPPERLAQAVTRLAEANTGHFASETAGVGGVHSRIEGDYRLAPPAARATVSRFDVEGEARDTEVIAIGVNAWSRDAGSSPKDAPCWIHHSVTELFANGLLVRNGDTFAPAAVAVVGLGRGVYATDDDQVTGTSELTTVLSVADLSLSTLLDLVRTADHRVSTTFTLDDDVLVGWRVFVRDAIEQAREFAGSNPVGVSRVSVLSTLGGAITTKLTDQGEGIDIAPPPADQVVEYVVDPAELSRRLAACGA